MAVTRAPRKQSISWVALMTLMVTQMMVSWNQINAGNVRSLTEIFYGSKTTPDVTKTMVETAAGTEEEEAINVATGIRAFRNAHASLQREIAELRNQHEPDRTISTDATPRVPDISVGPKSTPSPTEKPSIKEPSPSPTEKPTEKPTTKEPTSMPTNKATQAPPQPESNPKSIDKFTGSKITRLSMGIDLFENVCIVHEGHAIIRSYSKDSKDMKSTLGFNRGLDNHHVTYGQPSDMWYNDTAKWPLIKSDVLFTQTLYENPGHCISDYMMPVILDRHERKTLPVNKDIPEYTSWVRLAPKRVVAYDSKSYCSQLLIAGGYVQEQGFLHHRELCFERLYMPATEQYRFPVDQELMPIAEHEIKIGGHKLLLPSGINMEAPAYPREALKEFRSTLWQNMGLKSDPWTDREVNVVDKVGPRVLFYNRFGAKQRHWRSSLEVAKILEEGYHVKIDVIGEKWNSMNFTQQAELYNSYSHIVTVHGAHLANLIFSRPGTKVVEIVPVVYKELRPDESLKRLEDAKDQRNWYGPLGWFSSFTRQVDIEHFSLPADDHVKSVPDSNKGMDIDATRAANFIANRFALKPRDNTRTNK